MNNLHIDNSYNVWNTKKMKALVDAKCLEVYNTSDVQATLNRSYGSLYIEWWLHNIAYYLTKPFCFSQKIAALNRRAKDVDLEEHTKEAK